MKNKVTVLVPFYNSSRFLSQALNSIFEQTYPHWKIILINDGSTDDSLSKISTYLSDPRVTLINNEVNLGQSKSLNKALEHVTTPYFVQLDSDDWFYPHTLEIVMDEAKKLSEGVAVVGGNAMIYAEDEQGNRKMTYVRKSKSFNDRYEFLLSNLSLWPRCYRTSAVQKIGGWPTDDPYEGRYLEDKRILLKLIEDYQLHWIDQMLYNYRRHSKKSNHILI